MTTKQLQKRADKLYFSIEQEVGSSIMDLIYQLIEVEIQLEAESNK